MHKNKDILRHFGERVPILRKEKGLSQEEFAFRCRLDRTYISSIERGKRNISLINIQVISITLGISISELMKDI